MKPGGSQFPPGGYKGPSRAETARRVRERSEGVNPSRGLDEALDDRIERDDAPEFMGRMELAREVYRLRQRLMITADWVERATWLMDHRDVKHELREAVALAREALKVPDPSSGGNQDRGPDSSPTERGSNKDGA